jgi:polyhydroxyalkanoate synthesis repressor PhaR
MGEPNESAARKLQIKKYANRRYYDATHSRHLTLEEIRALIQQGYDIQVLDAKTSADITAQVLTQIILELDTPKLDSLPVPLLLRLIRMSDPLVKDFIEKYFNQALKSFLDYQQRVEEQIRQTHGLPRAFPSVSAWTKAMFAPFSTAFGGNEAEPEAAAPASPTPEPAGQPAMQEAIEELQREVEALRQAAGKGRKPSQTRRPHRSRK